MEKRIQTSTRFDGPAYRKVNIVTIIESSTSSSTFLIQEQTQFAVLKVAKEAESENIKEVKKTAEMIENYGGNNSLLLLDYSAQHLNESGEHPWLLMDYIPGISLHYLLKSLSSMSKISKKNMAPKSRVELKDLYKYQIIFAVSYTLRELHKHKYAHRNVTSSSILIDANDLNPHIIDFSMVSNEPTTYTKSSLSFTAPEYYNTINSDSQSTDSLLMTSDPSADVFSFGCVLLQVISFMWPFQKMKNEKNEGDGELNMSEIYQNFQQTGLFDPRFEPDAELGYLITQKDRPLYEIVKKCWTYQPEKRPTMDEVSRQIYDLAKTILSPSDFSLFNKYACSLKLENQPKQQIIGDRALIKMKLLGNMTEVHKAIDIGFCKFHGSETLKEAAKCIGYKPEQDSKKLDEFIQKYCVHTELSPPTNQK